MMVMFALFSVAATSSRACGAAAWALVASVLHWASVAPAHAFVLLSSYAAISRQYEIGTRYSFDYETTVLLNEFGVSHNSTSLAKDVGFKMDLKVDFIPVWQNPSKGNEQLFEIQVKSPELYMRARKDTPEQAFSKKSWRNVIFKENLPFFLHRDDGVVKNVYHSNKGALSAINIKKGIASLMQFKTKDDTGVETDTSGQCHVVYRVESKSRFIKTKTDCKATPPTIFFNHTEEVLSAVVLTESETRFEVDATDGSLRSCESVERVASMARVRTQAAGELTARQTLKIIRKSLSGVSAVSGRTASEAIEMLAKRVRNSLVKETLEAKPEKKECIACKTLQEVVNSLRKSLSSGSLGSQMSGLAFLRVLGKMRESDQDVIADTLKDKKNVKIIPQLLDIAAATQTLAAHNAAKRVVEFNTDRIEIAERYLLALALSTHPNQQVIEDLLKIWKRGVKDERLSETLLLTINSMTRVFLKDVRNSKHNLATTVLNIVVSSMNECSDDLCTSMFVRALKNLQAEKAMATLLEKVKTGSRKVSVWAMRAIQTMPQQFINQKVKMQLERVLFELDAPRDSSVRAMAAEVLLRWPTDPEIVADVIQIVARRSRKDVELRTFILTHLQDLCEKDAQMNELFKNVTNAHSLWNYDLMSVGGLSSAFSRSLIESRSSVDAYFTNALEIEGGILKRSSVDVFVDIEDSRMRLMSFGIFAGGLSMFGSSESLESDASSEEEEEDAHAGIEIDLMGSQLRPFVFFQGQSELMGHVWSGTASERTTALQGLVLLQDHSESVCLQNGLRVDLRLTGALSYDLAGQVQVSLWNRNAHSLVEVGAAVVLQGQMRVDTAFAQTTLEINSGSQTQLNFITDLEFSSKIAMCLQMVQPDFEVIDSVRKLERIPGTNYVLRKYKRKTSPVPGKTFVMNKKNTKLCNEMFSQ